MNPCVDFYNFACGGFVKRTVIPDDRTRMSSFSVLGDELLTQVLIIEIFKITSFAKVLFLIFHTHPIQ